MKTEKVIQFFFYFQLSKKKYLISSHLHGIHIRNDYLLARSHKILRNFKIDFRLLLFFVNARDCNQYDTQNHTGNIYFRQPHAICLLIRYLECHNKSLVGGSDTGFYVCIWFLFCLVWFCLRLLGQNLIEYSLGDQGLACFCYCLINLSFNLNGEEKF